MIYHLQLTLVQKLWFPPPLLLTCKPVTGILSSPFLAAATLGVPDAIAEISILETVNLKRETMRGKVK